MLTKKKRKRNKKINTTEEILRIYKEKELKYRLLLKKIATGDIKPGVLKTKAKKPIFKKYKKKNKTSAGERLVSKALMGANIKFRSEHIFDDCVNPKTNCNLRFDFYLPDHNTCIEFDGRQHYEYTPEFHGLDKKKGLEDQQYRDSVKDDYCQINNIKLIRIKYDQWMNIKEILMNNVTK